MHNLSDLSMSEIWGDSRHRAPLAHDLDPNEFSPYLSLPRLLTSEPVLLVQRIVTPNLTYHAPFPGPSGIAASKPEASGRYTLELRVIGNRIYQKLRRAEDSP